MDVKLTNANLDGAEGLPERPGSILENGTLIIRETTLTFDPGDRTNGSLYISDPSKGVKGDFVRQAIDKLRGHGLWSQEEPKIVRDDQRDLYESQLQFVQAYEFTINGVTLFAARYYHPKFPSSSERFMKWKEILEVSA